MNEWDFIIKEDLKNNSKESSPYSQLSKISKG